jgi:alkaline phosphatase D
MPRQLLAEIDRRRLLALGWQGTSAAIALALIPGEGFAAPRLGADPFTLGIASGDPKADGAVIWTRLAPDPLVGGGMPGKAVDVGWRVATDPAMRKVVQRGTATAVPDLAHSVHVEVEGLEPRRDYFYQFSYGREEESPIGHFRTAPRAGDRLGGLDFAVVTCQRWDQGHYTVLRDVAAQDLAAVFHCGDYLYEYSPLENVRGVTLDPERFSGETLTLARYRDQYALYKLDPDLQAAHAAHPFIVIWDDHEVQNDYSGFHPEYDQLPPRVFAQRRAAAYQAFYEHMPVRRGPKTDNNNALNIHRRLRYGDLATFLMLDDRQYRSDNPCGDGEALRCDGAYDPGVTMLGAAQEAWFAEMMRQADTEWTFIVQQLLVAQLDHDSRPNVDRFWNDAWDGYPGARDRLLATIEGSGAKNPVILTGDWHSTFANDIKRDFDKRYQRPIATEFVTPAISSGGDGRPYGPYYAPMIPYNPHIRYYEGDRRGYFLMRAQRSHLTADLRFVTKVEAPDGKAYDAARFVVESGVPGVQVDRV